VNKDEYILKCVTMKELVELRRLQ